MRRGRATKICEGDDPAHYAAKEHGEPGESVTRHVLEGIQIFRGNGKAIF